MKRLIPLVTIPISIALVPASTPALSGHARGYASSDLPDFTLEREGRPLPYRVNGVFLLPGDVLEARVSPLEHTNPENYRLVSGDGLVEFAGAGAWRWRAPMEPGTYPVRVVGASSNDGYLLNVFVMVPVREVENGRLSGYRIGAYPPNSGKGEHFDIPRGFVEVTAENQDAFVSPHFRLGQFVCKQQEGFPKYVVLREPLLLKLELVLDRLRREGYRAETFHVMSGYRTPFYNHAIGNVRYSRHVWGDAADIFVDADGNGMMDDLDRDGRIGLGDARVLYDLIDRQDRTWSASLRSLVGGLGKYPANAAHGPFVHLDTRGRQARW